jgi:hypothetical protein
MPTVRAIVAESARNGYTFESIVLGVANSAAFRMRGAAEPSTETVADVNGGVN